MKAKSIVQFLVAGIAFALAMVFSQEAAALVSTIGPQDLVHHTPTLGFALVSLANLDGSSYQKPNPGGLRRLLIIQARDIVGIWPKMADITEGEITVAPTFVNAAKFAQYDLPDGTFDLTDAADGDQGFQSYKQGANFMLAGFGKEISAEIRKHLNAGSVVIGEMNDGQFAVAGASDNPLYVKASFSSGKKGADKRGYTFKGEQDGFMWGVTPLSSTVATGLPLLGTGV